MSEEAKGHAINDDDSVRGHSDGWLLPFYGFNVGYGLISTPGWGAGDH